MQLYKKRVRIFDPMKNKFISEEDIQTKFGVDASKVIDVQSLAGDSSDNVPGVPGIGVKTAVLTPIPCLLYTSPSPRDATLSRMPSSA